MVHVPPFLILLTSLIFTLAQIRNRHIPTGPERLNAESSPKQTSTLSLPRTPAVVSDQPFPSKKYRITVCTMIKNEESYILEWIEFHRLQGVDHFVLYESNSDDTTDFIPVLYNQANIKNFVTIYTAQFFRGLRNSRDSTSTDHDATQNCAIQHCHRRFGADSQWMMIIDTDEFVYSPKFSSIYGYLNTKPHASFYYIISTVKFGTGGMLNDFTTQLTVNAETTIATIANSKSNRGSMGIPLIIESCHRRAPRLEFDMEYKVFYNKHCVNKTFFEYYCGEGGEKSIFKPNTCRIPGVHTCQTEIRGGRHHPHLSELRLDHHMLRTTQHVEDYAVFQTYKRDCLKFLDSIWFSAIQDDTKKKLFFDMLSLSLSRFSHSSCDQSLK